MATKKRNNRKSAPRGQDALTLDDIGDILKLVIGIQTELKESINGLHLIVDDMCVALKLKIEHEA